MALHIRRKRNLSWPARFVVTVASWDASSASRKWRYSENNKQYSGSPCGCCVLKLSLRVVNRITSLSLSLSFCLQSLSYHPSIYLRKQQYVINENYCNLVGPFQSFAMRNVEHQHNVKQVIYLKTLNKATVLRPRFAWQLRAGATRNMIT